MLAPVDIEKAVVVHLGAATKAPANLRDVLPFTRVVSVGGDRTNLVQERVRVTVECWAASEPQAFSAARAAWVQLSLAEHGWIGAPGSQVWLSRVELTSPANLPDTDADLPRYQFVAQLTVALDEIGEPA
jgi:hypothetical protein